MRKAIRSGEIKIGDLTMKVHVLEDGTRIIEEESLVALMDWMAVGKLTQDQADKFILELKHF